MFKEPVSHLFPHVFSADFAGDCVKNPCHTKSMPADFFLVTDKIMRKNPHIKRHGTSSKGNAEIRMERKRKVRGSFTGNQGDDIGRRAQR